MSCSSSELEYRRIIACVWGLIVGGSAIITNAPRSLDLHFAINLSTARSSSSSRFSRLSGAKIGVPSTLPSVEGLQPSGTPISCSYWGAVRCAE